MLWLFDIPLRVNPLTVDQNYQAQLVFKDTYDEALVEGTMCPIESKEMLEEHGIWNEDKENEAKVIEKEIEKLKINVYESFFKTAGREIARKLLRAKEEIQLELFNLKHSYDFSNTVGIATFARWNWTIENTTTYEDGSAYDWKDVSVQDVLLYYKQNMLDEKKLRHLANTEPWRSVWNTGKKEGKIFDKASIKLTPEQKTLMSWSMMYDSIAESSESPPDDVIQDDDALDGWLALQSQKRKREQEKAALEEITGKHPNAKDVFLRPESQEEMDRVQDLNDLEGQRIKGNRSKQIQEKGSVPYYKFDDVQRDLKDEIAASQ